VPRQRENDDPAYLEDLRESAAIVADRLRTRRFPDFAADLELQDSVIRRLTVIGQAARHLTPKTRKKYPKIPWDDLVAFRNMQAHAYWNHEPLVVWSFIEQAIPAILKSFGDD
jgi:uncharacterized protein with HEPN domain